MAAVHAYSLFDIVESVVFLPLLGNRIQVVLQGTGYVTGYSYTLCLASSGLSYRQVLLVNGSISLNPGYPPV